MTLAAGTKVRCIREPYDNEDSDYPLLGKTGVVVDHHSVLDEDDWGLSPEDSTVRWDDWVDGWSPDNGEYDSSYWTVEDKDLEVIQ